MPFLPPIDLLRQADNSRRFDRVLISAQLGNTDRRYPAQPRTVERQYKPLDPPGCADQLVILTTPAAMYELAGNC
jgi:hypothetical protein